MKKILSVEQIRSADEYTIKNEPISSINLMERASVSCVDWLKSNISNKEYVVFAGPGNNGGDGLAIARLLVERGCSCKCYYLESKKYSHDFNINLKRCQDNDIQCDLFNLDSLNRIKINKNEVIIDALFGSGLNRPLNVDYKTLFDVFQKDGQRIISIDTPSGVNCDLSNVSIGPCVKADFTLTFQTPKLSFLLPTTEKYCGKVVVLDIGLHKSYMDSVRTQACQLDKPYISSLIKKRKRFSHKGTYGHALLYAGMKGKSGAAILSAKACLRSGVGLLTVNTPNFCGDHLQIQVWEAMVEYNDGEFCLESMSNVKSTSIGIGPGIGKNEVTLKLLEKVFSTHKEPMVIDADALNLISENHHLKDKIPNGSILTPHPKEFKRLVGKWDNDLEKLNKLKSFSKVYQCYVVFKDSISIVCTPEGELYFNNTGNSGMATGGSGDVLTGILLGLLSQSYTPLNTCLLGVYLHGLAGDIASKSLSEESLIASDIIEYLPQAFKDIKKAMH